MTSPVKSAPPASSSGVELCRIDPTCNMRRFYRLDVTRDLFGGFMLLKQWGRIGTHGRVKAERFGDEESARAALMKHAEIKRRRGYETRHDPREATPVNFIPVRRATDIDRGRTPMPSSLGDDQASHSVNLCS